jgi:hypothetical protein
LVFHSHNTHIAFSCTVAILLLYCRNAWWEPCVHACIKTSWVTLFIVANRFTMCSNKIFIKLYYQANNL